MTDRDKRRILFSLIAANCAYLKTVESCGTASDYDLRVWEWLARDVSELLALKSVGVGEEEGDGE